MARITPIPDGPLKVAEAPIIRDDRGFAIETGENAFLCRCGMSQKKPFCDGSHKAAGFTTPVAEDPKGNRVFTYEGKADGVDVTVGFNPMLCAHAAECGRLSPSQFNTSQKPWVQPESGSLAAIRAVVFACPSGALTLSEGAGEPAQLGPDAGSIEIKVRKDGPYEVRNVPVDGDFNGAAASEQKYVLCRCGQSKNKPFCDGTHRDVKWDDEA